MSKPTKLGQIITVLFPEFVDKMVKLSAMRDEAHILLVKYRFMDRRMSDAALIKFMEKYYKIVYEFHDTKMWFMKDLPTLGHNNKVI